MVLFDALEEAAFPRITEMDGAGSLNETLDRIAQAGRTGALASEIDRFRVRVVLTAHPTQFYPSRVLGIITDLAGAIEAGDLSRMYDYLLQLGKTRFANRSKPTPLDEAQSLLWYLENVFYETFSSVQARVARAARGDGESSLDLPAVVELGFWPGGDRDGNPFVDADTTRSVAAELRRRIIARYLADLERLKRRLTFVGALERLAAIEDRLRGSAALDCVIPGSEPYGTAAEFYDELRQLWRHLSLHHDGLFLDELELFMSRVRVFGFHFATMDLRQDSRVHGRAIDRLIRRDGAESGQEVTDEERVAGLVALLDAPRTLPTPEALDLLSDDPVLRDTVESLVAAREIQAAGGSRALHRYIISNTRGAVNVLEVLFLARVAGYPPGSIDLDVVPLFETVQDLGEAQSIMNRLYDLPLYRRHLASRDNRQHIMLGFSDGTKDGGYMTANWLIYRTRRLLSAAAAERGITLIFFEGRGGPPARGGGKTHQFYRGMSRATAGEEIHLTIQGQTISSNFGNPAAARYNLEQLVTAGLETRLLPEDFQELEDEQRQLLEELSTDSLHAYRELKERPDFLPYLEEMTPLVYYGQANNASRPTSRSSEGKLRLEDLRAIPFVGAWSQMKQNIPGYFGFGSALERAIAAGRRDDLRRLFRDHLFFRTLVENSMQSLSKVNFSLTRFLAHEPRFADLWKTLEAEMTRTRALLLDVAAAEQLLPADAATRESIALRESIVFPVLVIQQYALARLREVDLSESEKEINRKLVVKSMAAIVNAGRNAV